MATLRPTTGSVSSLIRSAGSLATQQADYQDSVKAFEYSNSAYTDESFQTYAEYLNSRINGLNASPTLANATKVLSLTKALDSAGKSNISSSIVRENIQIMSGNATLQDKYSLVSSQYVRAATNGDMTLAQSLMSQAYSISQSIQLQQQQSADAANTLSKANLQAGVDKQTDTITNIDNGLAVLNTLAQDKSHEEFTKAAQGFVKANADYYATLGVSFTKGDGTPNTSPNYFDIVSGVMAAKYNAMVLKAQAENPINPQKASSLAADAQLFAKTGTQETLAGRLTFQQVQEAAQSPNMYVYDNANGKYVQSSKTGYQYQTYTKYDVVNGKVTPVTYKAAVPTFSGYAPGSPGTKSIILSPNQTALMSKLGLQIDAKLNSDGSVGTGIKVQATEGGKGTSATPDWLTKVVGKGAEIQVFNQNGQVTFTSGGKIYSLTQDGKGLVGLTEHNPDGTAKIVGGNYGYNPNPVAKGGSGVAGVDSGPSAGISSLKGPHMSLTSDFSTVNNVISVAQQREAALTAANHAAAQAMLSLPPVPLPNISIPKPIAPSPIAPAPSVATPSISWKTPSPSVSQAPTVASPAIAPAAPSGAPIQGGGFKLQ